jgi:hypothetical protein
LEPNLEPTETKWDEVFLDLNSQHGLNWAHPLDNEHLYYQFMKGSFSSLNCSLKNIKPKIKPIHFKSNKVEPEL